LNVGLLHTKNTFALYKYIGEWMSSLIARVRVEMGKQEHNPTLMIYQDTDIPSLVTDFVEAWEMPNAIYDKIYLEVVGELRKHGLMEADTSED
jgi:uncharacterized lipoprotein